MWCSRAFENVGIVVRYDHASSPTSQYRLRCQACPCGCRNAQIVITATKPTRYTGKGNNIWLGSSKKSRPMSCWSQSKIGQPARSPRVRNHGLEQQFFGSDASRHPEIRCIKCCMRLVVIVSRGGSAHEEGTQESTCIGLTTREQVLRPEAGEPDRRRHPPRSPSPSLS
jgi:hypothetical protein